MSEPNITEETDSNNSPMGSRKLGRIDSFPLLRRIDENEAANNLIESEHILDENGIVGTGRRWVQQRIRERRGSVLHRNDERNDHLRSLYIKRKLTDEVIQSMAGAYSTPIKASLRRDVSMDDIAALNTIVEQSYMEELRAEVKVEHNAEMVSERLAEIHEMSKEYIHHFERLRTFPLEVRLDNVSYTVPVQLNSKKIRTVYNSSFIYPITRFFYRVISGERKEPKQMMEFPVLSNINLVLKPGKQYLVLGAPGSGKSSLLKIIAGLIHHPKHGEKLEGTIAYNGRTLKEKEEFHIENCFGYIDQLDKHSPLLTVEETINFAYQCLTGGRFIREKLSGEAEKAVDRAEKEHLATRMTLAALGLTDAANTYVGDTSVQGVSGGQRRRVTIGEMLAARAPVLCGDEISTGLDAASTYDMIQVILHYGRRRKCSRIFALLQPSPETVSLFDEVIVLAEGQLLYAGPVDQVEDYFADIGFKSPPFTDVADFLQMITTEEGTNLYDPPCELQLNRSPPTVSELATIFLESTNGRKILDRLQSPSTYVWKQDDKMSEHGFSQVSDVSMSDAVLRRYANSFFRATELVLLRFLLIWMRDKRVIIAGAVKNVLMGVSVGGVFFSTDDPISIQGCLFQAGLFIMLGT